MNWKTWTVAAIAILAVFAIYTFAAPESMRPEAPAPATAAKQVASKPATLPGVEPIHLEWLDVQTGSYKSDRNLFAFREPPPPPPPPPPAPPPDKDKDGVPDFRDNCPDKYNPDQADIDHNGIGDICQTTPIIVPPPPPPPEPQPDPFPYKYIGTFGSPKNPIATFSGNGEIINARVSDVIASKFVLRSIGIESVEIGFIGFPPDKRQRIPLTSP
ncbi:MAG: thrombospondin type 3 repeat-containing protein [Thermoanaerobaculia bacterium]